MRISHLLAVLPLSLASASTVEETVERTNLGTLMALCDPDIPRNTLWISAERAYTCATLINTDVVASSGDYCISTATSALDGGEDLCASHNDCGDGGLCIEMADWRRVCWRLTWDKRCANIGL